MARKTKKSEDRKLAENIAPSDPKQAKPSRKNVKAPKSKAKGEAPVSGKLSTREAERSLWAPRVESKAKRAKKKQNERESLQHLFPRGF